MNEYTEEMENALDVLKRNPAKGAEIVVSLLQSKDDMVKLEAAIFILDRVLGKPKAMPNRGRKDST
ncbi:hypothetical protein COW82_00970 [Candidatus Campbellbacteria bacterium CG22_combo_CG10-13_8_21_14_all_43_18]|uniref:HEAT repeat domain-containing protein n=1 Tax=Candidatus Campbellbacteria bacterium CG22_combo_CG10-13_8_21_14_all_43_18 TaxID=1974530 RepID=A0A2H0DXB5_9BACT|nr:MAG: hypothetical protein COW82_00970 [Candidatus Campbellbacteria bacterium CG22_combo_CG10-13_8_21_14_all_43_18]